MTASPNPLLNLGFEIPFDTIEAPHIEPAIDSLISETKAALDSIGQPAKSRTYANTLHALEEATLKLERAMGVIGHLESVATNDALRDAYNLVRPKVSEVYAGIPLNAALYAALLEFAETEEAQSLGPVPRRFLEQSLRHFRRHGAELDTLGKSRLQEIDVELAKVTTRYAQNLLDETNAFELLIEDESRLKGLPESARHAARASAKSKGLKGYRFTLQAPSLIGVMTYLEDAQIRKQMWLAYNQRATNTPKNNGLLIRDILELRREKASLLGYDNFADFILEERMAKSGARAQEFLRDLRERTAPFFTEEQEELSDFREDLEGDAGHAMQPWDVGYYAECERRSRYDFDDEILRPYFEANRVLQGLFDVAHRLYGVRVEEKENTPVWDQAVRFFLLFDEQERQIGAFYVDLFPRENKRGGAWMNSFITGGPGDDDTSFHPHLGLFCANVSPPVDGQPALLTHREVETLFHEFGHLLHHCLSEVEIRSLAGTNVAWDFVELPSQIMENWCWEREALDLFARHHETDAPIPEALFKKMKRARTYRAASAMMRQLGFGHVDLALHVDFDPQAPDDPVKFARDIMAPFQPTAIPEDYAMICGFGHLFSSPVAYAAGYYSYKWAEVLDADAFSRFKKEGVFNPETGRDFRKKILAQGDATDPEKLFFNFMGRQPKVDALLARAGLLTQ